MQQKSFARSIGENNDNEFQFSNQNEIKHLILDFSCVNFIDSQGINCIQQVTNLNF